MLVATTVTVFFGTTQKILRLRYAARHGCIHVMVGFPQSLRSEQTFKISPVLAWDVLCRQLLAPGSPNLEHENACPAAKVVLSLPPSSFEPLGLVFMYGELGLKLVCYVLPSFDQTLSADSHHRSNTQRGLWL